MTCPTLMRGSLGVMTGGRGLGRPRGMAREEQVTDFELVLSGDFGHHHSSSIFVMEYESEETSAFFSHKWDFRN